MEVNSETFVLNTLVGDAFVLVNKRLLRYLHGDGSAAVFLGELISAYKYHLNNQSLDPDNSFPCPIRRFEFSIGVSEYKQHRILMKFKELGLCTVMLKGFPASKYLILDFDALARILAVDDLRYKKDGQREFYTEINTTFNIVLSTDPRPDGQELLDLRERALDNTGAPLRGTIHLISEWYLAHGKPVDWDPEQLGKTRNWVSKRAMGKPFDFTIVTRTLDQLNHMSSNTFESLIRTFIEAARATQDVHYSSQVLDYKNLLHTKGV